MTKNHIYDFYDKAQYGTITVNVEYLLLAVQSVDGKDIAQELDYQFFRIEIQLMRLNKTSYYKFALEHLIVLLEDYLYGKDSTS